MQRNIAPISAQKLASDAPYFPILPPSTKPNLDVSFLRQLRAILSRVVFPSLRSRETLILTLHSFFLVLRTVLSIAVARLDGVIVRDLVKADGKGFIKGLGLWFLLAIPSTYTNSMVCYFLCYGVKTKTTFSDPTSPVQTFAAFAYASNTVHTRFVSLLLPASALLPYGN